MNTKEAIVFFLPMALVFGTFFIAFIFYSLSGSGKVNKERFEHGKQMGAMTAQNLGCARAYKIADELPECAYKDGYVEGIAAIEDAEQRGL